MLRHACTWLRKRENQAQPILGIHQKWPDNLDRRNFDSLVTVKRCEAMSEEVSSLYKVMSCQAVQVLATLCLVQSLRPDSAAACPRGVGEWVTRRQRASAHVQTEPCGESQMTEQQTAKNCDPLVTFPRVEMMGHR